MYSSHSLSFFLSLSADLSTRVMHIFRLEEAEFIETSVELSVLVQKKKKSC